MSNPTYKDARVDPLLTQIAIMHKPQNFVAPRIFPEIETTDVSGHYALYKRGAFFRNQAGYRGPGGNARRSGYVQSTDKYKCMEKALAHEIPIENMRRNQDPFKPLETGTKFAVNGLAIARDVDLANLIMNPGNWDMAEDAAGGWAPTDDTNTFYEDILAGKKAVRDAIGVDPNVLAIDQDSFDKLKQSTSLLDRIKYTGTQGNPANVTPAMIAALLELEEVIILGTITSDAEETVAGDEFNAVNPWSVNAGKGSALLYYRPPVGEASIETPATGYCFIEIRNDDTPDETEEVGSILVRKWWEPSPKQWVLEASQSWDYKITCPYAGKLFYDTSAT